MKLEILSYYECKYAYLASPEIEICGLAMTPNQKLASVLKLIVRLFLNICFYFKFTGLKLFLQGDYGVIMSKNEENYSSNHKCLCLSLMKIYKNKDCYA